MKKAQGLSMNTIIIAALALIVLVILAMIFTGRIQVFGSTTKDCQAKGENAECRPVCNSDEIKVGDSSNTNCPSGYCCLKIY